MKRSFITLMALCLFSGISQAQSNINTTLLEQQVEQMQSSIDSLNIVISQARERYAQEAESREQIAKEIAVLEGEAINLKRKFNKALQQLTSYEQQQYAQSNNSGQLITVENNIAEDTSSVATFYPKRANLVANRVFDDALSATDLKHLRAMQSNESAVVTKIKEYLHMYDKMVALQLEYERVDNEIAADSVLTLLDSVRSKAELTEDAIKSKWHDIFDNKVYAYNLMMERDSKLDIISKAEQTLSAALISSEQRAEQCESEALVEYFYRKKALLNYEIQVADVYELSTAKDSLLRVSNTISESSFCLPKVTIVRRAFIDHEPIKVIKPTIYTPKNPIPHTKIYDYGTVYRVRIGIFTKRPNLTALKGITPLSYTDKYHNGKYAYFVGGYRTEEEALEGVAYLKKLGFRDPQLVMWVDGEYISNIAGWKSKNLGFNLEITGVTTIPDDVKAHISLRNEQARYSRVGSAFIVGSFTSKADADKVASEICALNSKIKVEVKPVK